MRQCPLAEHAREGKRAAGDSAHAPAAYRLTGSHIILSCFMKPRRKPVPTSDTTAPTTYSVAKRATWPRAKKMPPSRDSPKPVTRHRPKPYRRCFFVSSRNLKADSSCQRKEEERGQPAWDSRATSPAERRDREGEDERVHGDAVEKRERMRTPVVMLSTTCAASLPLRRAQTPSMVGAQRVVQPRRQGGNHGTREASGLG